MSPSISSNCNFGLLAVCMPSATALIGLLAGFKLVIVIFSLSPTIFPFHLLGLNGLIGAIDNFFEFKLYIGP